MSSINNKAVTRLLMTFGFGGFARIRFLIFIKFWAKLSQNLALIIYHSNVSLKLIFM